MFDRFHNQFKNHKYSSIDYIDKMQKALQDNAYCIKYFIDYSLEGNEHVAYIEARLMETQRKMGQWIGYFDHEKREIISEIASFIEPIKQAGVVFKYKINEIKFKTHWYERADNLMKLLSRLSDWDIRGFFYKQIELIEALIKSGLKKDEEAKTHYYSLLIENNKQLAMRLSAGIIKQYQKKFV